MIKAVHCFEGLTLWELDVQPFFGRVFFQFQSITTRGFLDFCWISPHQHRKQAWSAGPVSGPRKIRGVTALCWGVCQEEQFEQRQTRQPKCLHPKTLGFWILLDHFKPFSFLLFIFSNQQLLNCLDLFCTNSPSNHIPLSLCNKSMVFSEMHRIRQWLFNQLPRKATSFPTNQNHMGFHHLNHQAEDVFLQQLTICQSLVPTTTLHLWSFFSSPFLSAEPSRHHEMHPPDCWRTCDFNFV